MPRVLMLYEREDYYRSLLSWHYRRLIGFFRWLIVSNNAAKFNSKASLQLSPCLLVLPVTNRFYSMGLLNIKRRFKPITQPDGISKEL
jgi:hypothetical protein